jgi:carotenoid cleavage dioxygenase-like enzyme
MSHIGPTKGAEALPALWSESEDLGGYDMPIRLEGEIGNVIVRGIIPDHIDGTFYRVSSDHNIHTRKDHSPLQGHRVVSAFRIHKGRVDLKTRYVQNDRYKLERNRGQAMWAELIKDHPLNSHPCIQAVIDNTSNTNVIYWAGRLLALQETGPAWSMDPDTLETDGVDPYGNQIISSAMTAHPKVDQQFGHLVTYGTNKAGPDLISYAVDQDGKVKNEHRIVREIPGPIHDMAITENWLVFCQWPASFNVGGKPGEKC